MPINGGGNVNHCHDCERRIQCQFRVCEYWLCDDCNEKRFPSRRSPMQVINSLVNSISRVGRRAVQKAGSNALRKSTSSGSIREYLTVRPLSDLVDQSPPPSTQNLVLLDSQPTPAQHSPSAVIQPSQDDDGNNGTQEQGVTTEPRRQPATKRTSKGSLRRSTRINGEGLTVALPPLSPLKK